MNCSDKWRTGAIVPAELNVPTRVQFLKKSNLDNFVLKEGLVPSCGSRDMELRMRALTDHQLQQQEPTAFVL